MTSRLLASVGVVACFLSLTRCAHAPSGKGESPQALLEDACRPGHSNQAVVGSVWMKAASKEAKGQFPASVNASAPDKVTLEVTNLIGARQALIQVDHGSYTIDVPDKKGGNTRQAQGMGSWGGIPLRWASELFLGRIPCPSQGAKIPLRLQVESATGDLTAETPADQSGGTERFVYHFREWAGKPWPETLHWEHKGQRDATPGAPKDTTVDFKFDDPEDKTGSPKKWEAKSPRGEVKLRWSDLRITSSN